jgi:beta-lactamase class A
MWERRSGRALPYRMASGKAAGASGAESGWYSRFLYVFEPLARSRGRRRRSRALLWKLDSSGRPFRWALVTRPYHGPILLSATVFVLLASSAFGQTDIRKRVRAIAADAHGKVSVSCSLPDSGVNCDLEPHAHPPMQSVFKVPLALAALHLVEQGTLSLDQPVRFLASDRILPHTYSPLQDKYPEGGSDIPLRELLRLAVSMSDNVAADVVLRVIGGPTVVDSYVKSIGVNGFHLEDGEQGLARDFTVQYNNWFEPTAAVQLLRRISDNSPIAPEHTQLLLDWMKDSPTGTHRIKGELPAGTIVMHKTGSSDTADGVTYATNDIGLITLPDGRRLAIAIFITDSTADEDHREAVIARIAKAAYDACLPEKK